MFQLVNPVSGVSHGFVITKVYVLARFSRVNVHPLSCSSSAQADKNGRSTFPHKFAGCFQLNRVHKWATETANSLSIVILISETLKYRSVG